MALRGTWLRLILFLGLGTFSASLAGQPRWTAITLMLMAFLQRVVNGGGRVERFFGLGRGALDLFVEWRGARHAIEVKVRRDTETETEPWSGTTRRSVAPRAT